MSNGADIVYTFDGSFDGLMTAVFMSYSNRENPVSIEPSEQYQCGFAKNEVFIETDLSKSERVQKGIRIKLGGEILGKIYTVFLSCDIGRFTKIYQYLRLGFSMGRKFENHLQDSRVLEIENIYRFVLNERHYTLEFLRFSVLEGNIQYAEISPKNDQISLVMPHFCDRFPDIPFIIFDRVRYTAGVYDTNSWTLVQTDGLKLPAFSQDEFLFRKLWKKFYDTIAVEMRTNHKLRRNNMSKRYWKHMLEMNMSPVETNDPEEKGFGAIKDNLQSLPQAFPNLPTIK